MLCPDCQTYAAEEDIVCPRCGKLLDRQASEEEELMSFRQGRHLRRAESELPPPPVAPGSTGASRSFEDMHPRESAETTGAMYSRREQLASTGKFYGLQDGMLDQTPMNYEVGGSSTVMAAPTRHSRSRRRIRGIGGHLRGSRGNGPAQRCHKRRIRHHDRGAGGCVRYAQRTGRGKEKQLLVGLHHSGSSGIY